MVADCIERLESFLAVIIPQRKQKETNWGKWQRRVQNNVPKRPKSTLIFDMVQVKL